MLESLNNSKYQNEDKLRNNCYAFIICIILLHYNKCRYY